jgi:hypothetical protein
MMFIYILSKINLIVVDNSEYAIYIIVFNYIYQ